MKGARLLRGSAADRGYGSMTLSAMTLFTLWLAWGCAAPPDRPSAAPAASAETVYELEREVTEFLDHYLEVLESKDEQRVRQLFVNDDRFAWFTDGAKSYSSSDDVIAGMRRYSDIRFQTTLSDVVVLGLSPSLVSVQSSFTTHLTIPHAEPHDYGGVITWLLERQPATDRWRVLLGHTSTPGAPPSNSDREQ